MFIAQSVLFQVNMFYTNLIIKKDTSTLFKLLRILCCKILHGTMLRTTTLHVRMTMKVILKTFGNILSLWDYFYPTRYMLQNLRHQYRVMSTAKNDCINFRVKAHNMVNALLNKVISSRLSASLFSIIGTHKGQATPVTFTSGHNF